MAIYAPCPSSKLMDIEMITTLYVSRAASVSVESTNVEISLLYLSYINKSLPQQAGAMEGFKLGCVQRREMQGFCLAAGMLHHGDCHDLSYVSINTSYYIHRRNPY